MKKAITGAIAVCLLLGSSTVAFAIEKPEFSLPERPRRKFRNIPRRNGSEQGSDE